MSNLQQLVTALAADRHGVFTREQLRVAGISAKRELHAVRTGRWTQVFPTTYVVAAQPVGLAQRAVAATAFTGGVISDATAATLHGVVLDDDRTHVTVKQHAHVRADRLVVHHHRLEVLEVEVLDRVRVTTRARTAVDCAARLPYDVALQVAAEALHRRWIGLEGLATAAARREGWLGTEQLRRIIGLLATGGRSEAERTAHTLLTDAGIDGWVANAIIRDADGVVGEVDLLFAEARVVVEIDGYAFHSSRETFQRDRAKQNRLVALGYRVLRFTWADLTERPDDVVAAIRHSISEQSRPKWA